MYNLYFILDSENKPVHEPDLMKWTNWIMDEANTLLKSSTFEVSGEQVSVKTIFTGLNNSSSEDCMYGFMTTVSGGMHHGDKTRYSLYQNALDGHDSMVDYALNVDEPSYFSSAMISTHNIGMEERSAINEAKFEAGYKSWDERKERL